MTIPKLRRIGLSPSLEAQLDALIIVRDCSVEAMSLLKTLLSDSPQLSTHILLAICELPGLTIDDALLTITRVARLRVGTHGDKIEGPISNAADLLPVWFIRKIRQLRDPF